LNSLSAAVLGGLAGSANISLGSTNLAVGGNNASTTYSGALSGTGSLAKIGTGTLTLTNTSNTYSGGTTVGGGVLQFTSAGAIGGSGANVTVALGGTAAASYAINQTFLARVHPNSAGVVALAPDSRHALGFSAGGTTPAAPRG